MHEMKCCHPPCCCQEVGSGGGAGASPGMQSGSMESAEDRPLPLFLGKQLLWSNSLSNSYVPLTGVEKTDVHREGVMKQVSRAAGSSWQAGEHLCTL